MGRSKRQYASRSHNWLAHFTLFQGWLAVPAAISYSRTRKKNISSYYWNASLQDFLSVCMPSPLCQTFLYFHILVTGMELKAKKASKQELLRRYKLLYPKESEPPPGRYEPNGEIIWDEDGGIERLRERLGSISR